MSSVHFTEPCAMLETYPSHVSNAEAEVAFASSQFRQIIDGGSRAEPTTVKVDQLQLRLFAGDRSWEFVSHGPLRLPQAFENRRPGRILSGAAKQHIVKLSPAEFLRSFLTMGVCFDHAPDQDVFTALQAYARAHLGPNDGVAARGMSRWIVLSLAARAGAEPIGPSQLAF